MYLLHASRRLGNCCYLSDLVISSESSKSTRFGRPAGDLEISSKNVGLKVNP